MIRIFKSCSFVFLAATLSACAGGPAGHLSYLEPQGADISGSKPIIQSVTENTPAVGVVNPGDEVIEANGKQIQTRQDVVNYIASTPATADAVDQPIVVLTKDGQRKEIPAKKLWDPITKKVYVSMSNDGETVKINDPAHNTPLAATNDHGLGVVASLGMWSTKPSIIEVEVALNAKPKCKLCKLDSITLYSNRIERDLPLLAPARAGAIIYPVMSAEINPYQAVAVPAPVLTGFTSTTNTTGNVNTSGNINQIGNTAYFNANSSLNAQSTTNTQAVYDHSAQNGALMANMIGGMRNNAAHAQSGNRAGYIASHGTGTLKMGELQENQPLMGTLLFDNVGQSSGPFELRVKHGDSTTAIAFGAAEVTTASNQAATQ
jgi:hypothetical protein